MVITQIIEKPSMSCTVILNPKYFRILIDRQIGQERRQMKSSQTTVYMCLSYEGELEIFGSTVALL